MRWQPCLMEPDELIAPELDPAERTLLRFGLSEWGGPARCTDELAMAMGFRNMLDVFSEGDRLRDALAAELPLSRLDWCRTLLATEIVFASNLVGSGRDWSITTGIPDAEALTTLRSVQRKLTREVRGLIGHGLGTRPSPLPDHP